MEKILKKMNNIFLIYLAIYLSVCLSVYLSIYLVKIHVCIQYGDTTGVQYYMLQGPWVKRLRQLPREQKVLSDNTITACTSRVDFYMVAEQTILVRQSR